ncbi:hypothetical protein H6G35_02585 [Aulosira sp. FACHB-113]|uniref:hypothetical protein n=1 Tax=Tolypothrix tenuis TaxID=457083 RepID=UPI001685F6A4|nr:hypothetical protein [Aulosira sp. FACHB-113]
MPLQRIYLSPTLFELVLTAIAFYRAAIALNTFEAGKEIASPNPTCITKASNCK